MSILCVHGFGTRADARGMYTDIAAGLPDHEFVTFDLNGVDEQGNTTVRSLHEQAAKVSEQVRLHPEAMTVLCHSQGCIIVCLADLGDIKQVIFLAPPEVISVERFKRKFFKRDDAQFVEDGLSVLPRRDGTTTYVTPEYVESIKDIEIENLYSDLAQRVELTIIHAGADEILGKTKFDYLHGKAKFLYVEGAGHDFKGESRSALINIIGRFADK